MIGAIVSEDQDFHQTLDRMLGDGAGRFRFEARIGEPFTQISDTHLDALRAVDPDVIVVDLEADPQVGIKFAQYLMEAGLARAVVAAGPTDSPDLILQAMQAGVTEYLPKPLADTKVRESMDRVWRKTGKRTSQDPAEGDKGRTYCVFSAKGGSGSTTFAVNLAVELHRLTRKKTLLIDFDLELGETALLLGMEPKFSIADLIRNFHRVDAGLLASYIERDDSGIELLSAPIQPVDFESVDGERIAKILQFLKEHYEYIVIDAPKTLNTVTLSAFEGSDEVFILTTPDLPSIRNVSRCLPLLKGVEGHREEDWIKLVINRFSPRQLIPISEIEKTLGMKVYSTLRNDYQSTIDAINEGRPVVFDRNSIYGQDVRRLASEVTGVEVAPKKDGGLLGSLFSRKSSTS